MPALILAFPTGGEDKLFDPIAHREKWLRRLADEFAKLETAMPVPNFLPDTGCPFWVENLEREVRQAMFPVGKLKNGLVMMPQRLGGISPPAKALTNAWSRWVQRTQSGAKKGGGGLEAFAAGRTLAFGDFRHQKHRLKTDGTVCSSRYRRPLRTMSLPPHAGHAIQSGLKESKNRMQPS